MKKKENEYLAEGILLIGMFLFAIAMLIVYAYSDLKSKISETFIEHLKCGKVVVYEYNVTQLVKKAIQFCKEKNKDMNLWSTEIRWSATFNDISINCFGGKNGWSKLKEYSIKEFEEWLKK